MSEQPIAFKILADSGQFVGELQLAESAAKKMADAIVKSGREANASYSATRRGVESISRQMARLQKWTAALGGALAALGGFHGIAKMADQWAQVTGRLRLATKGAVDSAEAMERVYQVAQRTSSEMESTAGLVAKITGNLRDMGVESKAAFGSALSLAETINKTFVISGASAAAQSNAITQFTQSLAGGVLRAEEFNSVVENSGRLARALADGMGKSMGELRKAVNDGKVSAAEMLKAIQSQADVIDAEFQQIPQTIGNAWTQLQNAVLRYIGTADQARGVSARIAQSIKWVAENLDSLVNTVVRLGTVIAVAYAQKALAYGRAWVASLKLQTGATRGLIVAQAQWGATTRASFAAARAQIGKTGIVFAGLQAGIIGWNIGKYLHDEFAWARQGGVALVSGLVKGWSWVKQVAITAWEAIKLNFLRMVGTMRNALAGFFDMFADAASALPEFMGGSALSSTLSGWADKLRTEVVPTFGDIADAAKQIHAEFEAQRAIDDELFFEQFVEAGKDVKATSDAVTGALDDLGKTANGAGDKAKGAGQKLRDLLKARAEFAAENRRMEAQLAGPEAEAWHEYATGVAEARQALNEFKASQEEVRIREQLLAETRDRTLADIAREQDVLGRLRAEYAEHLQLAGLANRERRVEETLLRAINDAREKGRALTGAEIEQTREWLRQQEYAIEYAESQVRAAEDVERAWTDTWSNAADAMGDWFARGLRDGKAFFRGLMQMAQRWIAQLVGLMAKARLGELLGRDLGAGTRRLSLTDIFKPAANGVQAVSAWRDMLDGSAGGGLLQKLAGWLGLSRSGFAHAGAGNVFSRQPLVGGGYFGTLTAAGIPAMPAAAGSGHFGTLGMLGHSKSSAFAKFAPWAGGMLGGLYGLRSGGDTAGKLLGGASYGIAGALAPKVISAMMQQMAAGGGLKSALLAGGKALGPVGWAALAAVAINKISGGKLFGTQYKADSSALQIEFGDGGIGGHASSTEVKQRSLFRGRKWRTTTHALDAETRKNAEQYLDGLRKAMGKAAVQLGVDAPALLAAQFRREFDKHGNLTREFGTIAGRVYNEAQEAFTQRLQAENLLNVAKAAGGAAEIERLAERYRATPEGLAEYAELMLAVQADVKSAKQLWTDTAEGSLTRVVEAMERLSRGAETLAETYQRVTETAGQYGELMAGIDKELRTSGLNQWQKAALDIETQYRQQVQQANALAKALGLSGARSEDLAKIELLRARRMTELQTQLEKQKNDVLQGFALSEYSPLTDRQKLDEAMQQLQTAVQSGDLQAAQNLAQTALGLGRNLYASGSDYNALYAQVTGMIRDMSMPALVTDDGTTMGDLAQILLDLPTEFARALYAAATGELPAPATANVAVATPNVAPAPQPAPAPAPVPPARGGGGGRHPGMGDVQVMGDYDMSLPGGPSHGRGRLREVIDPDAWSRIEALLSRIADNSDREAAAVLADQLRR